MKTALLLLTSCLVVANVPGAIASERHAFQKKIVALPACTTT